MTGETKITYGDRTHYYISGIASINEKGEVVFLADVRKQAERVFQNINTLLSEYDSDINELASAVVYLREASDYHQTSKMLDEHLHNVPHVVVHAPICRPNWLIEVEGVAISDKKDKRYAAFF